MTYKERDNFSNESGTATQNICQESSSWWATCSVTTCYRIAEPLSLKNTYLSMTSFYVGCSPLQWFSKCDPGTPGGVPENSARSLQGQSNVYNILRTYLFNCIDICNDDTKAMVRKSASALIQIKAVALNCTSCCIYSSPPCSWYDFLIFCLMIWEVWFMKHLSSMKARYLGKKNFCNFLN